MQGLRCSVARKSWMSSKELLFETFGCEYQTIGKLRFRRYRDLLGGEAAEIDGLQREGLQAALQMMSLAKRISDAKEISFDEALQMLSTGSLQSAELFADFADEAFMLVSSLPEPSKADDQMITLFMRSRAQIQDADGNWQGFEDWSIKDSRQLPAKLREEIKAFIEQEQNGEAVEETTAKKAAKAGKAASAP